VNRKLHILGDTEVMSIWVGDGSNSGKNERIDLYPQEWDNLVAFFTVLLGRRPDGEPANQRG
jgi:hypothetical protein